LKGYQQQLDEKPLLAAQTTVYNFSLVVLNAEDLVRSSNGPSFFLENLWNSVEALLLLLSSAFL
jgi:hypothetical protein